MKSKLKKGKAEFTPCSDKCPAVTGKPYGSVQYCPMAEPRRHRKFQSSDLVLSGTMRREPGGRWVVFDWRVVDWVPSDPEAPVPLHKDQTDCCANFQCCRGKVK